MNRYTKTELKEKKQGELFKIALKLGISIKDKTTKSGRKKVSDIRRDILTFQEQQESTSSIPFEENMVSEEIQEDYAEIDKKIALYIQINRANLIDYFSSALIYPVNYEMRDLARSQRTRDAQSVLPNHLLISDGFVDKLSENQVLLEVILTEDDKKQSGLVNTNTHLLPYPLPISRVNKIHFANTESQQNTLATVETFQDTYLPSHLFCVWTNELKNRMLVREKLESENDSVATSPLTSNKEYFNRVLGMLSFMKNSELYYSNDTKKYSNYSDNYFKLLSLISPYFEAEAIGKLDSWSNDYYSILLNKETESDLGLLKTIIDEIYQSKTFKKNNLKQILGLPKKPIQDAFRLLFEDETAKALEVIDRESAPEYILLAFLYRFRDKEGNDKVAIKEQITDLINIDKLKNNKAINRMAIVLATLGLYYGYKSLPKNEYIKFNDNFYDDISENGKVNIKFKLDSMLDKIVIESVFQYCFFNKKESNFDFLGVAKKEEANLLELTDGYEDFRSGFFAKNDSIIKLTKSHTAEQKDIKERIQSLFEGFDKFSRALEENGIISNKKLSEADVDRWLYKNEFGSIKEAMATLKDKMRDV
jgi:hypothetical protein